MLTTDDDALAERIRFLNDRGMSKERRYFRTEVAFNYRMTNLQAALGRRVPAVQGARAERHKSAERLRSQA
jgi:dTDP-4-amino-4,6-dideoxygalactose transaminase